MSVVSVAIAALLAGTALPANATPAASAPIAPHSADSQVFHITQTDDYDCMMGAMVTSHLVASTPLNDGHDADRKAAAVAEVYYYLGKLVSRDPDFDFGAAVQHFDAIDRPRLAQDHALMLTFSTGCHNEFMRTMSALTSGGHRAGPTP